jgi:plastocyanin
MPQMGTRCPDPCPKPVAAEAAASTSSISAFRINGAVHQAQAPAQPSTRQEVSAPTVAGRTVADTVVLGQTWDSATVAPSGTENLSSVIAMAPAVMTVPAGTKVTFENPSTNSNDHCARSFFDPASFKVGPLAPGASGSYTFVKPGTYYYNDCAGFPWNTGEIIVSAAARSSHG